MGVGLGLEEILLKFIKLYCAKGSQITFVLNVPSHLQAQIIHELHFQNVKNLPKIIQESTTGERSALYQKGGVVFVSSTVLVLDLLKKNIRTHCIDGFLIYNAHYVTEGGPEELILSLYRQTNKTGFIKAFTEHPSSLIRSKNYSPLEKIMKSLRIRQLYLWPRFHENVIEALDKHQPDVIELHQPLSPLMQKIQSAIIEIINACIIELKSSNMLDLSDLNVEEGITSHFDLIVRNQLDPIWYSVGIKTKQLVGDLQSLRKLLVYLIKLDCVSFNRYLEAMKATDFNENSDWRFLDAADTLFSCTQLRVYRKISKKTSPSKVLKTSDKSEATTLNTAYELTFDPNPKWGLLSEVLKEIENSNYPIKGYRILITVKDQSSCSLLQEYLEVGGKKILETKWENYISKQTYYKSPRKPQFKKSIKIGKGNKRKSLPKKNNTKTLRELFQKNQNTVPKVKLEEKKVDEKNENNQDSTFTMKFVDIPHIVIQSYENMSSLEEIHPNFVILYDPDVAFVRRLEVYKCESPGVPLRVYFLIYENSIEEQLYLSHLRNETESFEKLIRKKETMVIREFDHEEGIDIEEVEGIAHNARKGGRLIKQPKVQGKILVDVREFRSQLPSTLYHFGFEVVPLTLEVGDYILTPDICIERKSTSDLYSSFKSGRLYSQMEAMCNLFAYPILLIEFSQNQTFSLQSSERMNDYIQITDITSRIVLLVKQFPKMRIIWSRDRHATASIFSMLKEGKPEPKVEIDTEILEDLEPQEFLRRLPGITNANFYRVVHSCANLYELSQKTQDQMEELIGKVNGKKLYDFFNTVYTEQLGKT